MEEEQRVRHRRAANRNAGPGAPDRPSLGRLEDRLTAIDVRVRKLERSAEAFDDWDSCLTWVPVTEYGDPETQFGYEYNRAAPDSSGGYSAAVAVDRSAWDEPDYEVLAFAGRDDPDSPRECGTEPGEGVDRVTPSSAASPSPIRARDARGDRIEDLAGDVGSMAETVDDLFEPIEEFDLFDQCMFTIGMTQYGSRSGPAGYSYFDRGAGQRPALAMDMAGFDTAEHNFMAFPGEEPPQIECNEDAGGQGTDE